MEDFYNEDGEKMKYLRNVAKRRILESLFFINEQKHNIIGVDQAETNSAIRLAFIIKKDSGSGGNDDHAEPAYGPVVPPMASIEIDD